MSREGRADRAVVVGASLPLTGPLAGFGVALAAGYRRAFAAEEARPEGPRARLVLRDNASDAAVAQAQARALIVEDGARALLGAAAPAPGIALSFVAERRRTPLLLTIVPIRAWQGASEAGWRYAWNIFFDEGQMTRTQLLAARLLETNRRVALFTDLDEDGVVMGGLWTDAAADLGFELVHHAEFPAGTRDLSAQVAEARAARADIAICQVTEPDGRRLLEAIDDGGWEPRLLFLEKAANTGGFGRSTGGRAEGVLAANWYPAGGLEAAAPGRPADSATASEVLGVTAAAVLLDAIGAAGQDADADALNAAIGATDAPYPYGHVRFDAGNASEQPAVMTQWRGDEMVVVMEADGRPGAPIRPSRGAR